VAGDQARASYPVRSRTELTSYGGLELVRPPERSDYEVFELCEVALQSELTLPQAKLAYKTCGKLSPARDNVIVIPSFYSGQHTDNEAMIRVGRALDPARYFIVVPNMFGNGLSSSGSLEEMPDATFNS
jgi:homoserine O-acetyltransferase/O-succinyltransferase